MLHFQSRHYIVGDSEKSPLFYITVLASAQIFEHCGSAAYTVVALDICAEDMSFSIWKKKLIWNLGSYRSGRLFSLVKFLWTSVSVSQ